ncbi:MAG: sugar ABC transporter substrate-binding protein [Firmicutes bacterium]|nr:sugar ABC transporter substrate-binding protein [Bacillota bacterium]
MKKHNLTKRALFVFLVVALVGACSGLVLAGDIDWRQAEGTSLFVALNKHVYADALQQLIPEFEELTGIKVVSEVYSQDEYMNKRLVDLSSRAGVFDIVMMDQAVVQYARAGWIEPLDGYINDPTLFNQEAYALDDFFPSLLDEGTVDGKIYAIPVAGETQVLYYRTDVFEEKGIQVPKTFDELYETAVALNDRPNMAGILLRGQKIHTAWNSSGFVWSYGGRISDDPMNPTKAAFDSPEAAEAITMYAKLLQDAGPLGAGNYTWYEAVSDFQQGKAAMYLDASVFMGDIENPEKSLVAGKVGYAPMPAGPAGNIANSLSWLLSMSSSSKNKKGAALFLAWATGKETSLELGVATGVFGRKSVLESDAVRNKYPRAWSEAVLSSLEAPKPEAGFPRITEIDEWLDIYGGAVNATILGQRDAKTNLERAAAQMNKILSESQ